MWDHLGPTLPGVRGATCAPARGQAPCRGSARASHGLGQVGSREHREAPPEADTELCWGWGAWRVRPPAWPRQLCCHPETSTWASSWRMNLLSTPSMGRGRWGAWPSPASDGPRLAGSPAPGDGGWQGSVVPAVPTTPASQGRGTVTMHQGATPFAAAAPRTGPASRAPRTTQPHVSRAAPGSHHTALRRDEEQPDEGSQQRPQCPRRPPPASHACTFSPTRGGIRCGLATAPGRLHHRSTTDLGVAWFSVVGAVLPVAECQHHPWPLPTRCR